jgi:acetyl esterase/lipase
MNLSPLVWPEWSLQATTEEMNLDENGWYHGVTNPELRPFLPLPDRANGTCILICPGGSYQILDWVAHVERLAALFTPMGYAVVGLKYRVSASHDASADALADLRRAIEVIHTHADDWRINPDRLVGLGYSAGSNLLLNHACDVATEGGRGPSCATPATVPYMALLCLWPHNRGCDTYDVTADVSTVLLCATDEDDAAPSSFSQAIGESMKRVGVSVTTKVYPRGNHHAFNFEEDGPEVDWTPAFLNWLGENGLD